MRTRDAILTPKPITTDAARAVQQQLEVKIMKLLRTWEDQTGCRVTQAKMTYFMDTRYFKITSMLGHTKLKKAGE